MKANRFVADRQAVSNVVGAILFFALVVIVLVMVRTVHVPAWTAEQEGVHMSEVQEQFARIKGQADQQVANASRGGSSEPLTLFKDRSGFFMLPASAGTVELVPGGRSVHLASDELTVFTSDQRKVTFGASEDWVRAQNTVADVGEVQHLRIRVLDPESEDTGDSVTLAITDAEGAFAGSLKVYIERHPSGYAIKTQVLNATGVTIYDQGESLFQQDQPAMFWINALADEVQFRDVLNAASTPMTLTLSEQGMKGEYTIRFMEDDGSGVRFLAGSGVRTEAPYAQNLAGGSLRFESRNSVFPDQALVLENGAVVLEQEDGAVFLHDPAMSIHATGTRVRLELTVPMVTGDANAVSKRGTTSIALQSITSQSYAATAPMYTFQVDTEHPALWADFWRSTFEGAGLNEASGAFALVTGTDHAAFTLYGPQADPGSTSHDLNVHLHQAQVELRLSR